MAKLFIFLEFVYCTVFAITDSGKVDSYDGIWQNCCSFWNMCTVQYLPLQTVEKLIHKMEYGMAKLLFFLEFVYCTVFTITDSGKVDS